MNPLQLAAPWRTWILRSLLLGEAPAAIEAVLQTQGLCEGDAAAALRTFTDQPWFDAAREAMRPVALVTRLRQEHLRLGGTEVPRRRVVALRDAVVAQTPVVLTDLTVAWPALQWTWAQLTERLGDVVVPVCVGRNADPRAFVRPKEHEVHLPFREVVQRLLDPSTGDDVYVVANNEALEGPLQALLNDVRPVPDVLPSARLRESSAWIGAAGAFTPLHHDTSDILFVPFLGRKQVVLLPPEELEVAYAAKGFWADDHDLAEPDLALRRTVVEPGEALLIPSGWWHQVTSLDPSLTLTFAGLGHANAFPWYTPGVPGVP